MRSVHPGEVLKQELEEHGVAPLEFARQIDVPVNWISEIIAGDRSISGDTALRFGHWFGANPQFWMNLQSGWDLQLAIAKVGKEIAKLPASQSSAPSPPWESRTSNAVGEERRGGGEAFQGSNY